MAAMNAMAKSNRRYLLRTLMLYSIITILSFIAFTRIFPHRHFSQHSAYKKSAQHQTTLRQNSNSTDFPLKIWQVAKSAIPALDSYENQDRITSWIRANPSHRYETLTDDSALTYVKDRFPHHPEMVSTFTAISDGILRADLIRYIALFGDGGVYTDLDTVCLKPISEWIPRRYREKANLVLGVEGDSLGGDLIEGFSWPVQFSTWTMMAKPGHPLMELMINRVVSQIKDLAHRQNTTISGIKASYMDVIDTTGPGIVTGSVYEGLSEIAGQNITSANITGLVAPKLIGDVLIMPITAFGAGLPHSNAGPVDDEAALVQHLLSGSWKAEHTLPPSEDQLPSADELAKSSETFAENVRKALEGTEANDGAEKREEESGDVSTDEAKKEDENTELKKIRRRSKKKTRSKRKAAAA